MRAVCAVALCCSLAACSSYETTYFSHDENGQVTTRTVAGVPIVVTVPQKLGFIATESLYEVEATVIRNNQPVVVTREVTEVSVDKVPIPLGRSELVTLDIKRPAYGTAKTKMALSNQYPTELTTEVDDKTLDRALETLEKFVQKQGEGSGTGAGSGRKLVRQRSFMIVYDPQTQKVYRQTL